MYLFVCMTKTAECNK